MSAEAGAGREGCQAESEVPRLELQAHAKLNLGLSVLGRRADGLHEIDTLFVRLALHDDVLIEPAEGVSGELLAGDPELPLQGLRMDDKNLAIRAARIYLDEGGGARGVRLGLRKRIPVAAGLGGGSSDAAAVLKGMGRLYPSAVELVDLALRLGSDLPFFLADESAAWGGGRGELLEPARLTRQVLVLLNPGIAVSASGAYGQLRGFGAPLDRETLLARLAVGEEPGYWNSLETGVVESHPVVGEALEALREAGLRGVLMSGSGPTCFGLASTAEEAARAAERLRRQNPEWWVWAGATI